MRTITLLLCLILTACSGRPIGWDRLQTGVTLMTPDGAGPFPLVVLMHGCGGQSPFLENYALAANESGHAAILLDSWAARDIDRAAALRWTCSGAILRGPERAGDIHVLLDNLDDPRLDLTKISLAGWSHGGWAAAEAMTGDAPPAGVTKLYLNYPYCGFAARWRNKAFPDDLDIEAVIGDADTVSDYPACAKALNRDGIALTVHENATHAFDDSDAEDPGFVFQPDLAARNIQRFQAWLTRP